MPFLLHTDRGTFRLLIAVNPYAVLPIYGEESMAAHSAAALGTMAPHIYGTSAACPNHN